MSAPYRPISASCHCANIRVALDWPASLPTVAARVCGCSFCTKHGCAWTAHPEARFALSIADDERVTRYRFGTKTADFHICRACGVVPIVICTIEGTRYAVFNVNTFDGAERAQVVTAAAANFEAETTDNRLARRRHNWAQEVSDQQSVISDQSPRSGAVAGLVENAGGVVSEDPNLESSGVGAPDRRPRHDERYHDGR